MLPLELFDSHAAFVGKTGSGKTYAAKGIVERLLDEGRRVVVLDPTGVWWGLRSSADGKAGAYPVVVFGGEHADVPIVECSGEALARLIVAKRVSCVVDVSQFYVGALRRFSAAFAETLFAESPREPLHLVIDEADEFMPQRPLPDAAVTLSRFDRIVRRGRARGFRVVMITQRPAVLNKDCLTQVETLVALRLTGPQDRKAVEAWIDGHGDVGKGREVLDSLARLARGEGWAWSPAHEILKRLAFAAIGTFDSSRSPETGEAVAPATLARVDISAIREALAEAEKDGDDGDDAATPTRTRSTPDLEAIRKTAHREGFEDGLAEATRQLADALTGALNDVIAAARSGLAQIEGRRNVTDATDAPPVETIAPTVPAIAPASSSGARKPSHGLTRAQQRMIDAVAGLEAARIAPASKLQVALLADVSPRSSGYANNLGALRTAGLIDYPTPGAIGLTTSGRRIAKKPDKAPTTADLHFAAQRLLSGARWRIVAALVKAYPRALTREDLARAADASPDSSGYANNLGALRSLGLIDYPQSGSVVALPALFMGGKR